MLTLWPRRPVRSAPLRGRYFRPVLECLEDRLAPAGTVTTLADNGAGSLRTALGGGGAVNFQAGLTGTITLASTLTVAASTTITGPGAGVIAVSGNNAVQDFYINSGVTAVISGLTISNGNAGSGSGGGINSGSGGGILNIGTLTLQACTVSGNVAINGRGGGIANAPNSSATVQNCTISGNTANNGGGISNFASFTVVQDSTLSGNTASTFGGGIYNLNDTILELTRTLLAGNTAVSGGGAIANTLGSQVVAQNCTFSGNAAMSGGGIDNFSIVTLQASTLSGNNASTTGGGITNENGGKFNLGDTIVAGNSAGVAGPDVYGAAIVSQGHNLIGNSSGGGPFASSDLLNVSAGLDPNGLQNNGGPTQTIALLPNSLAIGRGQAIPGITTDQRGIPRPQGLAPDIGAFELQQTAGSAAIIAIGADAGGGPQVNVYDAATNALKTSFLAFPSSFTGGVRVAVGDVNGDGIPDIIVGAGPGGGPEVRVFDGTTFKMIRDFFALPSQFTGGVFVAAGDVNGDGFADIITSADRGGGPQVTITDGKSGQQLASFYATASTFTGGIRVAAADLSGNGFADVIAAAGPGGGPQVTIFDGKSLSLLTAFYALPSTFTGGMYVAAGDVNGDGKADIIVGAAPGGGPEVSLFNGPDQKSLGAFYALTSTFTGGVRVGAADTTTSGHASILTAAGPGGGPQVSIFDGLSLQMLNSFFAYPSGFTGGVFVGG